MATIERKEQAREDYLKFKRVSDNVVNYLQMGDTHWAEMVAIINKIDADLQSSDPVFTVADYNLCVEKYNLMKDSVIEKASSFVEFNLK